MIRTSTRTRALLAVAVAGLAVPAGASAITTPSFAGPVPAFIEGTTPTFVFLPGAFDESTSEVAVLFKHHQISLKDLTVPAVEQIITVNHPDVPVVPLGLTNGHRYAIKIRARETLSPTTVGPDFVVATAWTPEATFRVDATSPAGSFEIAGGSNFVNTRDVTLTMGGIDPLSDGNASAGVGQYQITNTALFPCPGASCPVTYAQTAAHTLTDGPDGPRTVSVRFRDNARPFFGGFDNTPGNESPIATDTVLLDRVAPTPNLTTTPGQGVQGAPISFSATGSTDGATGPNDSGVDPAGYQWDFGDGSSATGVTASHTYGAPRVYNGTLTMKDRAGNSAVKAFSITVSAPAPRITPTVTPGTTPVEFSLGKIQLIGTARAFRTVRIRVAASAAAGLRGKLTRTVKGRVVVVTRFSKAGGPGVVGMSFRAPRAGLYRLVVSVGDLSRARALRVTR
jgi:PKD domain